MVRHWGAPLRRAVVGLPLAGALQESVNKYKHKKLKTDFASPSAHLSVESATSLGQCRAFHCRATAYDGNRKIRVIKKIDSLAEREEKEGDRKKGRERERKV